jgi:hypothetical protein
METDPLGNACQSCQGGRAPRPMGEIHPGITAGTQHPREANHTTHAPVGSPFIVPNEVADRRMMLQQGRGLRSGHDIQRPVA